MRRWIIAGLLLLMPSLAHGQAGTKTWFIDPDAAAWSDYSSLSSWDAAKARDLTSADSIYIAECMCSGGTASTTAWAASASWATDATRYIKVWTNPDSTYRYNGTYQTGNKYRLEVNSNVQIDIANAASNVCLVGLQMKMRAANYSYGIRIDLTTDGWTYIEQCLIDGNDASLTNANSQAILDLEWAHMVYCSNCIIYDIDRGYYEGTGDIYCHNCTAQNCTEGFYDTSRAINCMAQDCTDGFYSTTGTENNNCSDIVADAPGANARTGEVLFVNEGANNFHVDASDTVVLGYGADLSGDGTYPITVDIDNQTRSDWDIGADEAEDAAGGGGQVIIIR